MRTVAIILPLVALGATTFACQLTGGKAGATNTTSPTADPTATTQTTETPAPPLTTTPTPKSEPSEQSRSWADVERAQGA